MNKVFIKYIRFPKIKKSYFTFLTFLKIFRKKYLVKEENNGDKIFIYKGQISYPCWFEVV